MRQFPLPFSPNLSNTIRFIFTYVVIDVLVPQFDCFLVIRKVVTNIVTYGCTPISTYKSWPGARSGLQAILLQIRAHFNRRYRAQNPFLAILSILLWFLLLANEYGFDAMLVKTGEIPITVKSYTNGYVPHQVFDCEQTLLRKNAEDGIHVLIYPAYTTTIPSQFKDKILCPCDDKYPSEFCVKLNLQQTAVVDSNVRSYLKKPTRFQTGLHPFHTTDYRSVSPTLFKSKPKNTVVVSWKAKVNYFAGTHTYYYLVRQEQEVNPIDGSGLIVVPLGNGKLIFGQGFHRSKLQEVRHNDGNIFVYNEAVYVEFSHLKPFQEWNIDKLSSLGMRWRYMTGDYAVDENTTAVFASLAMSTGINQPIPVGVRIDSKIKASINIIGIICSSILAILGIVSVLVPLFARNSTVKRIRHETAENWLIAQLASYATSCGDCWLGNYDGTTSTVGYCSRDSDGRYRFRFDTALRAAGFIRKPTSANLISGNYHDSVN